MRRSLSIASYWARRSSVAYSGEEARREIMVAISSEENVEIAPVSRPGSISSSTRLRTATAHRVKFCRISSLRSSASWRTVFTVSVPGQGNRWCRSVASRVKRRHCLYKWTDCELRVFETRRASDFRLNHTSRHDYRSRAAQELARSRNSISERLLSAQPESCVGHTGSRYPSARSRKNSVPGVHSDFGSQSFAGCV